MSNEVRKIAIKEIIFKGVSVPLTFQGSSVLFQMEDTDKDFGLEIKNCLIDLILKPDYTKIWSPKPRAFTPKAEHPIKIIGELNENIVELLITSSNKRDKREYVIVYINTKENQIETFNISKLNEMPSYFEFTLKGSFEFFFGNERGINQYLSSINNLLELSYEEFTDSSFSFHPKIELIKVSEKEIEHKYYGKQSAPLYAQLSAIVVKFNSTNTAEDLFKEVTQKYKEILNQLKTVTIEEEIPNKENLLRENEQCLSVFFKISEKDILLEAFNYPSICATYVGAFKITEKGDFHYYILSNVFNRSLYDSRLLDKGVKLYTLNEYPDMLKVMQNGLADFIEQESKNNLNMEIHGFYEKGRYWSCIDSPADCEEIYLSDGSPKNSFEVAYKFSE